MEKLRWIPNQLPAFEEDDCLLMDPLRIAQVRAFHESIPGYQPTPLHSMQHTAAALGLGGLYVKDESKRFGLNAFKVLGSSYAIARYAAQKTGREMGQIGFQTLTDPHLKREMGETVFFTATDGNHGRGVAWAANRLGQRAVVRMPAGTAMSRLENIRKEGAEVTIEAMNYDDCVRLAAQQAAKTPGGVLMQDTAWEGYEQIPGWIMQGYGTMAAEAADQLPEPPTHVFLQAGVGSLAGAVAGYLVKRYPDAPPRIIVVEAAAADCHYRSALRGDGQTAVVEGEMPTMMAGLACGEPNPLSWRILRRHAGAFVSCPDWVSALGMRMLAAPAAGDPSVVSGESGAVGMGLVAAIMQGSSGLKEALGMDKTSRVLLFSTEGDTDPVNYRRVVRDGVRSFETEQ